MTIYDKPVRLLFRDLLQDLKVEPGQIVTRKQILSWFQERYPNVEDTTVRAHIRRLSTNHPGRVNWDLQADDDLLFHMGGDQYRLYQPDVDPEPIRSRDNGNIRAESEAELLEAVQSTPEYEDFQETHLAAKGERETRAWALLEGHRGKLTVEALNEIFDTLDLDPKNSRWFGSLLAQPNRNLMFASSVETINAWVDELLFRDRPADEALDWCLGELKLKGASAGLATLLLYLKDPARYAVWLPATEKGLVALSRLEKLGPATGGAGYRAFNEAAHRFRADHEIEPRELDWHLTFLGNRARREGSAYVLTGPTSKRPKSRSSPKEPGEMTPQKKVEFEKLFEECATTFLSKAEGQQHLATYEANRAAGRANYQAVASQAAEGRWSEDLTDAVLRTLLPHSDTAANRERGAWVHVAPSFSGDVRVKFEGAGWARAEDWPEIAQALFRFLQRCEKDPGEFEVASEQFEASGRARGFQTGALTPILNALRPDEFCIVNSKPLRVLNHFAGSAYRQTLSDYPAVNRSLHAFAETQSSLFEKVSPRGGRPMDFLDAFSHWLVALRKFRFDGPTTRYWKVAPGADAWNWETWLRDGIVTIRWDPLGDLSRVTRAEFEARRDQALQAHTDWNKVGVEQVWKFANEIREGDRIVANHGTKAVLGIGTVAGPYQFVPGVRHGHRIPVEWDDTETREVQEGGWKRTLVELDRKKFDAIVGAPIRGDQPRDPDSAFTPEAFALLEQLHGERTAAFYQERKGSFHETVEEPFRALLRAVAARLPETMQSWLETEKKIFGRIPKNDYGRGGAWDFYWGAFYPKGGKRIQDAQLFAVLTRDRLDFGFYVGEYGSDQRMRFLRNAKDHGPELLRILAGRFEDDELTFGDPEGIGGNEELAWEEWLSEPGASGVRVGVTLRADEVLRQSREALVSRVAQVFESLFPLLFLATLDDPLPEIAEFLEGVDGERNEEYPLPALVSESGCDLETLSRWVRAIERKGQAILYGPPGTGKTYLAERLARHLVAGGDGFWELVQFHPTYAYEDFIQGIRPRAREDGGIEYPLVPGRFLEFCRKARGRKDPCVLIVDEINRANLSRVFGELMYLLEYRDSQIPLAGGERFSIPPNVRLLGTLNTADRSIALVDHALRRRFAFLELYPSYEILERFHDGKPFQVKGLVETLKQVNTQIEDPHYHVGISFFLRDDLEEQIEDIWRMEIEPYLDEYFFDQRAKAEKFRWDEVKKEVLGRP